MNLGRDSGYPPRKNLSGICSEKRKHFRILVVNLLNLNIKATPWHLAVGTAQIVSSLFCLRFHRVLIYFQINYRNSRWSVRRLRNGLYFTFSSRPGVRRLFLFRVVTYRDGGEPASRASVHSSIIVSRAIFSINRAKGSGL